MPDKRTKSRRGKSLIPEFRSLEDILKDAMDHEEQSTQYYQEAAQRTDDPELKSLLEQLAATEAEHRRQLEQQLEIVRNNQAVAQDLMYAFGKTGQ